MGVDKSLIEELREREEQRRRPAGPARPAAAAAEGDAQARAADAGTAAAGEEEESPVHTAAYGFFRGRSEWATFLEFQLVGREWLGASYADLRRTRWRASGNGTEPGAAFVLEYADGLQVTVRGRNLRAMLEGIQRQRVFRVSEMGEAADRYLPEEATVVYAIAIAEPEGGQG